jgi:hypothetical protein
MTRIRRINADQINADQISAHPPNPRHRGSIALFSIAIVIISLVLSGCHNAPASNSAATTNENPAKSAPGVDASTIVERNVALDNSHDSTTKLRAQITGAGTSGELEAPRRLQLTIYRKHQPDGRLVILIEFTSPPEERDRDGLITVFPDARIEAIRYVQSTDSFIETSDATSEDALFGLTAQELAEGQPEKYDFSLSGDDTYNGQPVYRLKGTLKQRADSKFPAVELLISKQNFTALQVDFLDNHNELARRLAVSRFDLIGGHWTRMNWSIDNRARQKKIDFEAVDVKYDQKLSDSIFTREHLQKIASRER